MYKGTKEERNTKTREWYHKVGYSKRVVLGSKLRRIDTKKLLMEYKETLKCVKCGETHIACLDFHHRDPSEKEITIASAINRGYSLEKIMKEIEKCDVLCCKCHRILHYEEFLKSEVEERENILKLKEGERPKYITHKRFFSGESAYVQMVCDMCGKEFKIRISDYNFKVKRGQTHFFHDRNCASKWRVSEKNRKV